MLIVCCSGPYHIQPSPKQDICVVLGHILLQNKLSLPSFIMVWIPIVLVQTLAINIDSSRLFSSCFLGGSRSMRYLSGGSSNWGCVTGVPGNPVKQFGWFEFGVDHRNCDVLLWRYHRACYRSASVLVPLAVALLWIVIIIIIITIIIGLCSLLLFCCKVEVVKIKAGWWIHVCWWGYSWIEVGQWRCSWPEFQIFWGAGLQRHQKDICCSKTKANHYN